MHLFAAEAVSQRQLELVYGEIEHSIYFATNIHTYAAQSRDKFLAALPPVTSETVEDVPRSAAELAARFIEFLIKDETTYAKTPLITHKRTVDTALDNFETVFLQGRNIHVFVASLPVESQIQHQMIRSYYSARQFVHRDIDPYQSTLFEAARVTGPVTMYAVFGGQGNTETYFDELREVYSTYPSLVQELLLVASELLQSLLRRAQPGVQQLYSQGLDPVRWLRDPSTTPSSDYLLSAPVSFPLIGLTQLAHYCVTCKILGQEPGYLIRTLSGLTGHSQGIVVAAAIATATTWIEFQQSAEDALSILFAIGSRSQQVYPPAVLPQSVIQQSIERDEGSIGPMLNISGLSMARVQALVDEVNSSVPVEERVNIALVNGPRNFVVAGSPLSLCGLSARCKEIKLPSGATQAKIPFSNRKAEFTHRFLPITAPFHSPYLLNALPLIEEDVKRVIISSDSLRVPLYHTFNGEDLRTKPGTATNIVPALIRMVTYETVNWPKAVNFPGATHVLDFGPGGSSGIGVLTQKIKDGTGMRVILTRISGNTGLDIGYLADIVDRGSHALRSSPRWAVDFRPSLVRLKSLGTTCILNTKFSRFFGLPPLMVAAMTPTSASWDFVAAVMNAGYHAELAAGGLHSPAQMTEAINQLANTIPSGRGITINLIYASPHTVKWQIPVVKQLIDDGSPIDGLSIGAGVPSLDVAHDYITNIGLKHITFKPGSVQSIQQVLSIAKANPHFPIILQWTGGRGGGHHSYEDFHQPILEMYGQIRRCENIILVAGSGFGGAEDTYPYLTGTWASERFGRVPMPFDACMFGSRMMITKESHLGLGAKKLIAEAKGVDDDGWEQTYRGPAGDVITVQSELGEPIHMLATRGVRFWEEMDRTVFSLDKGKRAAVLEKQKAYIIKRLNADFQKVWFPRNPPESHDDHRPIDLTEMTYSGVAYRMLELLYVRSEGRWIDKSYITLTGDFLRRIEERFVGADGQRSVLPEGYADLADYPFSAVERLLGVYSKARSAPLTAEDAQYFLHICRRRGQKPVPFVPVLNEDFEYWFKKDSLWQCEDLQAVVGQDAQRTCILQGPVAAKYSTIVDETVKEVLDRIHSCHVTLLAEAYENEGAVVPSVEYLGAEEPRVFENVNFCEVSHDKTSVTYFLRDSGNAELPDHDTWIKLLAGRTQSWRHALLTSHKILQRERAVPNMIRRIFTPAFGISVHITYPDDPQKTVISVTEARVPEANAPGYSKFVPVLTARLSKSFEISVDMYANETASGMPEYLTLKFEYRPEAGYAPIREIMDDRNERIKSFYHNLWFGHEEPRVPLKASVTGEFDGGSVKVSAKAIADFVRSVGITGEEYIARPGKTTVAPMDLAIVFGWKAVMKAIFPGFIPGDILSMVHLSNSFELLKEAEPIAIGDNLRSTARLTAIVNQDSGKMVEVSCIIRRDGIPVMEIKSRFLFRGRYDDFDRCFEEKTENPVLLTLSSTGEALLRSKRWLFLDEIYSNVNLVGQQLIFRLFSRYELGHDTTYRKVKTTGDVFLLLAGRVEVPIGTVSYTAATSKNNPVLDFLQKHATPIELQTVLETPIPLGPEKGSLSITAPPSNAGYAAASGDFNPIHVSRAFADYVGLPGTITHGMYVSAAVRQLVETWAAEGSSMRMKKYNVSFVGMTLPNDHIDVVLEHTAMQNGRKVISIEARNTATQQLILTGESEVEQAPTVYLFTGQGSQEPGMGMDLYASSPAAKEIWDRADRHFLDNYGEWLDLDGSELLFANRKYRLRH
jgi:fatty acid synthase subunit beta